MKPAHRVARPAGRIALVGLLVICGMSPAAAQDKVEQIVDQGVARGTEGKQSQQRIDTIADQTGDLLSKYKTEMKVVDGLQIYNALLQRQLDDQAREAAQINESIDQVSVMERQIVPLLLRMLEGLSQFVELDVPFLLEERHERVARLKRLLENASVTSAEKFRSILEAFQIENEFGRTIEAYKGSLEVDGKAREVDFLRIGRVALLYQSVGGRYNGVWDQHARQWQGLDPVEYKNQIAQGLRIARKQVAPDLLMLPVAAAGDVQ